MISDKFYIFFFFQAEDGIRDYKVTGVQTCALPICRVFAPEVDTATVALITPAQGAQLLVATGYVVPQRKANISPRIGGRVAKIFVQDGTVVKEGQVIAVLEDADY